MDISSSSYIIAWLAEAAITGYLAVSIFVRKQYHTQIGALMLIFFTLVSLGLLFWAIPAAISKPDPVTPITSVIGDTLFISGISFSWIIIWYVFFRPKKVSLLWFALPLTAFVATMATVTFITTHNNPPYFNGDELVIYTDKIWYQAYSANFLGMPIVGLYFLKQSLDAKTTSHKFRGITWGVTFIVVGTLGLLSALTNSDTQNYLFIAILTIFALSTLAYRAMVKKQKQAS